MPLDTNDLYPQLLAEEDIMLLNNIVGQVLQSVRYFRFDLAHGAVLSNFGDKNFKFAGIDLIGGGIDQCREIYSKETALAIYMPSTTASAKTKIGELFNLPVYADPQCPPDQFLIKPVMEEDDGKNK